MAKAMKKAPKTANITMEEAAMKAEKAEKKAKVGKAVKLAILARKLNVKIDKLARFLDRAGLEAIREQATEAEAAIGIIAERLEALPQDWTPPRKSRGEGRGSSRKTKAVIGGNMRIRDKFLPEYEELLDPADQRDLKLVAIRGNKAVVDTTGGGRLFIPFKHIEIQ